MRSTSSYELAIFLVQIYSIKTVLSIKVEKTLYILLNNYSEGC